MGALRNEKVYQGTISSQIKYNASSGKEEDRFRMVFGLIGLELWQITYSHRLIMGKHSHS